MIDNTFGAPVAEKLNDLGAVTAKTTKEYGFSENAHDDFIINKLRDTKHLLLTHDYNTINERKYPACSHGGIILIMNRRWTVETIHEDMKAFCKSGFRKHATHCVTRLYRKKAIIFQHENERLEIDF